MCPAGVLDRRIGAAPAPAFRDDIDMSSSCILIAARIGLCPATIINAITRVRETAVTTESIASAMKSALLYAVSLPRPGGVSKHYGRPRIKIHGWASGFDIGLITAFANGFPTVYFHREKFVNATAKGFARTNKRVRRRAISFCRFVDEPPPNASGKQNLKQQYTPKRQPARLTFELKGLRV